MTMNDFFGMAWIQLATLAVSVIVFFVVPVYWHIAQKRLPSNLFLEYKKVSLDVYVQVALRVLIPVAIAFISSRGKGNLTAAVTNAYLGISLAGGAAALWAVRKAHISQGNALAMSNTNLRTILLDDVYAKNLRAFTAALIATAIGIVGLLVVNLLLAELPSWFWFACFLCTIFPVYAQAWSLSVQSAATKYEQDPKHGTRKNILKK